MGYNPDESALEVQDCGWYGKAKISGVGTQNDPILLLCDNAKIRMQVHNYSAPYSKPVELTIFGDRGSSSFYGEAYANFTLTCGTDETKEVVIDLLYDASKPTDVSVYDGEENPDVTTEMIPLKFYSGRTSLDKDKLYLMYIQSPDDNSYLYPRTYFKIASDLFTGVEDVAVDRYETPRYFDLTGREVASPTPGTIYIRIIGGKATKLIYR